MNNFLPYSDFAKSAACLDRQRCGNQRRETLVALIILHNGNNKGWIHHPAVRMWKGCEVALAAYGLYICNEWHNRRGYKDTCFDKIVKLNGGMPLVFEKPSWLGDERVHSSHRAALLAKNYQWYSQFGWEEKPEINYYWPV